MFSLHLYLISKCADFHFSQDMFLRMCCAVLLWIKTELLSGDFAENLKLLQHYPDINVEYLVWVAQDLAPPATPSYRLSPLIMNPAVKLIL